MSNIYLSAFLEGLYLRVKRCKIHIFFDFYFFKTCRAHKLGKVRNIAKETIKLIKLEKTFNRISRHCAKFLSLIILSGTVSRTFDFTHRTLQLNKIMDNMF